MRLYLAGPMRGVKDQNKPEFNRVTALLRTAGHVVYNPAEEEEAGAGIRVWMEHDTRWICREAEAVALLDGWSNSRGARTEKALAEAIGIPSDSWRVFYDFPMRAPADNKAAPEQALNAYPPGIFVAPLCAPKRLLPSDPQARKKYPMGVGLLDYFPDALAEVSKVSWTGNQQHNPGQPTHWARAKSMDQDDTLIRHFIERGCMDTDGCRHSAKLAWRALALLQIELENELGLSAPRSAR
jgi:hypothetical protein